MNRVDCKVIVNVRAAISLLKTLLHNNFKKMLINIMHTGQ